MSDDAVIRDLVARFADAVNRLDVVAFEALWTPEATWIIDPPTDYRSSGPRAEIASGFETGMRAGWKSFSQYVHGTVVELDGDRAVARSYLSELGIPAQGEGGYMNYGTYIDQLERTTDGWRFKERHYRYLYLDTSPLRGEGAPLGGRQTS
jgi:ketosteroid isomerase-like protein